LRRLSYILGAMSEASRLEDSLRASQRETVDLRTLLEGIGCAYADSYEQPIQLQLTPEAAPSHTAPELLVQALDKLVDNACSFALPDTAVTLSLGAHPQGWRISVHNHGPRLPDTLRARLFEPMVSLRSGHGEAPHLGLGLHIVALIMEHLEGEVRAENDADGGGVCFSLLLPRADLTA
jgi:signal transduction histidine kinase